MSLSNAGMPLFIQRLPTLVGIGLLSSSLLLTACDQNNGTRQDAAAAPSSETESAVLASSDEVVDRDLNEGLDSSNDETVNQSMSENPTEGSASSESTLSVQAGSQSSETSMPAPNSDGPMMTSPMLASTDQPSLVTNPTEPNTPEDTVKQALDTLYYGDAEDAVGYYEVDMANFEEELANTQHAFQQTVIGVTMTNTTYNADKTQATIEGELMLRGQSEPAPLAYQLKKINGQWKILG